MRMTVPLKDHRLCACVATAAHNIKTNSNVLRFMLFAPDRAGRNVAAQRAVPAPYNGRRAAQPHGKRLNLPNF
jgi:hypothetical protein